MNKKYNVIQIILSILIILSLITSGIDVFIRGDVRIWDYVALWIVAIVNVINNLIIHVGDYNNSDEVD